VVRPSKRVAKSVRPVRDAQITQQQILDAAEYEFSRHGLNGARMSAIANRSGVTTATLHYYFESKESLYKQVLVDRLSTEMIAEHTQEAIAFILAGVKRSHP
jgi:TetR/AcrR family transcriptional regulator